MKLVLVLVSIMASTVSFADVTTGTWEFDPELSKEHNFVDAVDENCPTVLAIEVGDQITVSFDGGVSKEFIVNDTQIQRYEPGAPRSTVTYTIQNEYLMSRAFGYDILSMIVSRISSRTNPSQAVCVYTHTNFERIE